jgi:hypothetical protein
MVQLLFSGLGMNILVPKSVMGLKIWFLEISSAHFPIILELILFLKMNVAHQNAHIYSGLFTKY